MMPVQEGLAPTRTRDVSAGTNGCRMHPMVWYCQGCDADTLPAGPRQNEGHVAVRFGRDDQRHFDVFEGNSKHLGAYEVQAGPGGWIIEAETPVCACVLCRSHLRLRLRYGDDFRIVRNGGA